MAIDEFEIDYRHFVFIKSNDGFKTKKILPKVKVRFSLDIGLHERKGSCIYGIQDFKYVLISVVFGSFSD